MFKNNFPYIIAEVGSNHLGRKKLAKKSIVLAKKAGANCVKFQLFDENNLVNKKLRVYKHVKDKKYKFQYERFKKVKISINFLRDLSKLAKKIKIDISVSPFDASYIRKIKNYIKFFKIASGDINNYELLREIAKTKKKVVISTGMSSMLEIKKAISFFPKKKITLLHCISSYPTKDFNANLINIKYLREKFKLPTGYSDHVPGINVAANSVFFGATMIEKHFMPSKNKLAGDYQLSVDHLELKKMISLIKKNLSQIGKIRTKEFSCEKYSKRTLRRSVYYKKNLKKNLMIQKKDLCVLRPYNSQGVKIESISKIIGRKIKKDVRENQIVQKKNFSL